MEVYKDISSTQNKEFQKLLIDNFSKTKIEEGKLLTGTISKVTENHVYLLIDGMKSEALIDVSEVRTIYGNKEIKENDKLEVYLEKIEDKNGEVIVSASRAQKIRGWYILEKSYESNQNVKGKIISKCKGGVIVEHSETKSLMFCPGSQIDSKPIKSFDHLFNVEQDFKIIKLDKFRGNACVSRREVISSFKKECFGINDESYKIWTRFLRSKDNGLLDSFTGYYRDLMVSYLNEKLDTRLDYLKDARDKLADIIRNFPQRI